MTKTKARIQVTIVPHTEPVIAESDLLSKPYTSIMMMVVKNIVIIRAIMIGLYPFRNKGMRTFQIMNIVIINDSIARTPIDPANNTNNVIKPTVN